MVGELVTAEYPNETEAVFVYARDLEGNILELQSWRKKVNGVVNKLEIHSEGEIS